MVLISHRGNVFGAVPEMENNPQYILSAASEKYFVEIDAWKIKDSWWLGHDAPQYEIKESFLKNKRFLVHAKNLEALKSLMNLEIHCFWHQEDHYTITNRGVIIAYPGYACGNNVICMKPELLSMDVIKDAYGICSDYIGFYNE